MKTRRLNALAGIILLALVLAMSVAASTATAQPWSTATAQPCADFSPGDVVDVVATYPGKRVTIQFVTEPTGTPPFTFNFDLNGDYLGNLFDGVTRAIDFPVQNSIDVRDVDPKNQATLPFVDPNYLATWARDRIGDGSSPYTFYDLSVTDANGCKLSTRERIKVTFNSATLCLEFSGTLTKDVPDYFDANGKASPYNAVKVGDTFDATLLFDAGSKLTPIPKGHGRFYGAIQSFKLTWYPKGMPPLELEESYNPAANFMGLTAEDEGARWESFGFEIGAPKDPWVGKSGAGFKADPGTDLGIRTARTLDQPGIRNFNFVPRPDAKGSLGFRNGPHGRIMEADIIRAVVTPPVNGSCSP